MENRKTKFNKNLIALWLMVVAVFACFLTTLSPITTHAEEIQYTSALEDLQVNKKFNAEDYPTIADDYSLQVITIAESVNSELFVYVYQPSASENILATSINISTAAKTQNQYINYSLEYVNCEGTLFKYIVKDFALSSDIARYYEISSIFRAWNKDIDNAAEGDNTITEVSYPVAKQFTLIDLEDGTTSFNVYDLDLITITSKYVGFVRYLSGINFWGTSDLCDSHFVAFGTDKSIDKLLEADVYFQTQEVSCINGAMIGVTGTTVYGDIIDNYSNMTDTSAAFYKSNFTEWYNSSYSWQRIQTIDEFVESENLSNVYQAGIFNVGTRTELDDDALNQLKDKQWVLRFYESSYVHNMFTKDDWTIVSNVSLLRLKFETNDVIYDLGIVDNKQSGSDTPSNDLELIIGVNWPLTTIALVIVIVIIVIILLIIFAPSLIVGFVKLLIKVIAALFKGLWWLITAPFSLFKDKKE